MNLFDPKIAKALLRTQAPCCKKKMKVVEFYSLTAGCRKCGCYISIETGQYDEEEIEDMDGKDGQKVVL